MSDDISVTWSSVNVFADLGLPDAEEANTKAELVSAIADIVRARRYTQAKTAEILEIPQPKVSALLRGKLSGFSVEKLMHFLNLLGHNVKIVVEAEELPSKGALSVVLARIDLPLPKRKKVVT
ncbi:MAG TPA: transcriptional regulator [Cyanobacteria bacterium UBA8530]|nr:transcriptional regulator [Cyanobacteria bacterium UBA8530]